MGIAPFQMSARGSLEFCFGYDMEGEGFLRRGKGGRGWIYVFLRRKGGVLGVEKGSRGIRRGGCRAIDPSLVLPEQKRQEIPTSSCR